MKVEIKEMTDTRATLIVDGVNHAFVNALRRTLMADVPKMSIEDVTVYDNTSAIFDEMIAHRLGLVPIPTDLQAFVPREECTCENEGCTNCTILYTLSKEGPGLVVSGDLTPADPAFKLPDPDIPIAKLVEGQRVMLEAGATMGTGRKHAKFQPVHGASYREVPIVDTSGMTPLMPKTIADIEKSAPADSVVVEDGKLRVIDAEKADTYLRSAVTVYDIEGVKLDYEKDKFIFRFETDGALHPKDALQKALEILMEKMKHVEAEVPKLKLEEEEALI
jgi:DNA-directed RNA polymerase subunit D